jgi:hypothetical protein
MKKAILFLPFVFVYCAGFAQGPIPNSGFENWTSYLTGTTPQYPYELPDLWRTTDSITVVNSAGVTHSASKEVSQVYSGTYSLHLQSWSFLVSGFPFINGIPGCATSGNVIINTGAGTITPIGGTADTIRHAQLNGFYKYTAGGNGSDSGSVEVCLFKRNTGTGNRDTVATGRTYFHNQATYTPFNFPIIQYGSVAITPDSMLIWIQSSPREPLGSGQTGSILLVDSLAFSGTIGINEIPDVVNSMNVFPVPASNELNIVLDLKRNIRTSFEIIDITGKKILNFEMQSLKERIDIHELNTGNYFYNLLDEHGNKLKSGKFSVSR